MFAPVCVCLCVCACVCVSGGGGGTSMLAYVDEINGFATPELETACRCACDHYF